MTYVIKETMTCEEFFEAYIGYHWNVICDEMYWDCDFSSDLCLRWMQRLADKFNIELSDVDTWDYEDFFYKTYKDTEKGLS